MPISSEDYPPRYRKFEQATAAPDEQRSVLHQHDWELILKQGDGEPVSVVCVKCGASRCIVQ
jgi:hypothetical protein